jgi:thioredoxin 1
MTVRHIKNSKEADYLITENNGKIVVIDYWADWCGPCVGFAPTFEKMSAEFPAAVFAKVNVDECPEAADAAGISSIPSFHIFLNGARQEIVVGAAETRLRDAIKKVQAKL